MIRSLVIFLHGIGSQGADLSPLADMWRRALPQTVFAAPDAPVPFDGGRGHQWFSIKGITEDGRPARVIAARDSFDAVLGQLMREHEVGPERTVLVGFSQGAIMALDLVASGRLPLAGVVAVAGRLTTPAPLTPATDARALLIHGSDDHVIPPAMSVLAEQRLTEAGVATDLTLISGMPHTIDRQAAEAIGHFLIQAFRS
ncbi:alpha/beta hydrolase [Falsirhodobacter xinxiangensis]|uniref:alpha/beta hydrolase n=1 Tax=Falsirhodobacter xinxiangensis TaxID=2530049 RepID=UPI0010A9A816|nr:alpha/beta fold hydrolase [Rhodobacter xinxiangensis]